MEFNIAVLCGDGVGPEVVPEGLEILQAVAEKFGHSFGLREGLIGGIAIDTQGKAQSKDALRMCKRCDAALLDAVPGHKWDDPQANIHPEDALLALRKGLRLHPEPCIGEIHDKTCKFRSTNDVVRLFQVRRN
jgi:3-isopropylmalate dehydrogenase